MQQEKSEKVMKKRERNGSLFVVLPLLVVLVEVLLCCIAYTQQIGRQLLLGNLFLCGLLFLYAYFLRQTNQKCQSLAAQNAEKNARIQLLQHQLEQLEQQRWDDTQMWEQQREQAQCALLEQQATYQQQMQDLCSSISHEIRLPVSVAAGYADLLRHNMVDSPQERNCYLEKIAERLYYMNDLLTRHIDTLRNESGEALEHLQKSQFDMVAFLTSALQDFRPFTQERGIALQLVTIEPELWVSADRVLLLHMLDSLVENAAKYMQRSGTVTFILMQQGDSILLTCQDDGMGMDEEQAMHIFQKGFRGKNTSGKNGSGHGLHMVDVIVHAHGGSAQASSTYGSGLRIAIKLPISVATVANKG